jgi:hypothetical protein
LKGGISMTKKEFIVLNPEQKRYTFMAYDKFEAIYYAKKRDNHQWDELRYFVIRNRKKNDLQIK